MLVSLLVLLISLIPAILVYIYLSRIHGKDHEFHAISRKALWKGVWSSAGVVFLALILNILWSISGLGKDRPLLNAAVHAFLFAAFAEEFVKSQSAAAIMKEFTEPVSWMDLIAIYGIVALGFNFIESFVYSFNTNLIQIIVRGITVPHVAYGLIIGYFKGKALYTGNKGWNMPAFLIPFFLHGMYDFSIAEEFLEINDNLVFVPFILIFIDLIVLVRVLLLLKNTKKNGGIYITVFPDIIH